MKRILFLLLFPLVANAFQSQISGIYRTDDYDNNASSNGYGLGYTYYLSDLSYDALPFNEASFLTATSSISFLALQLNYSNSNILDSTSAGITSTIYQDDYSFEITALSGNINSSIPGNDADLTLIEFKPGFRIDKQSLLFVGLRKRTLEKFDRTTTGVGFKNVTNDLNIVLQYDDVTQETAFENIDSSIIELTADYYLNNHLFVGVEYIITDYSGISDDETSKTLKLGGLINKAFSYELEYTDEELVNGSGSTAISAALNFNY